VGRRTTIALPPELRRELDRVPGRTMAEKVQFLLRVYREYLMERAKQVVCNDLKSEELYVSGWYRRLTKELGDPDAVAYAFTFLKQKSVEQGMPLLVVDEEKCRGGGR